MGRWLSLLHKAWTASLTSAPVTPSSRLHGSHGASEEACWLVALNRLLPTDSRTDGGGPERPSLLWPEGGGKMPGQLEDVESPSSLHTSPSSLLIPPLLTLPAAPQAAEQGALGREYSRVLCLEGCGYTDKGDPHVMWGQYVGVGVCWGDTVSQRQDRAPVRILSQPGQGSLCWTLLLAFHSSGVFSACILAGRKMGS